jgi:transposase
MRKKRTNYSGSQKVAILRRHLVDGVPIADLCDEYRMHPTVLYRWQRELFERGTAVFEATRCCSTKGQDDHAHRIATLEERLRQKDELLLKLTEEYFHLKKKLERR